MRKYFFENIKDLIGHLKSLNPDMGPIRLQKTLYFLFAFYGATYGSIGNENNEEKNELLSEVDSDSYPKQLFADDFEAWQFGQSFQQSVSYNTDLTTHKPHRTALHHSIAVSICACHGHYGLKKDRYHFR